MKNIFIHSFYKMIARSINMLISLNQIKALICTKLDLKDCLYLINVKVTLIS